VVRHEQRTRFRINYITDTGGVFSSRRASSGRRRRRDEEPPCRSVRVLPLEIVLRPTGGPHHVGERCTARGTVRRRRGQAYAAVQKGKTRATAAPQQQ